MGANFSFLGPRIPPNKGRGSLALFSPLLAQPTLSVVRKRGWREAVGH